jgi:crotonobetainyl-CoA:carnitine CoA-transferase CaiB-like acyl-CoA transferase
VARLEAESVPVAVVNTLDQVVADPQIRHRGMVTELATLDGRHARVMGNPMKFADASAAATRFAPRLGEDTGGVLQELLELSAAEIDDLERNRVVKRSP